MKKSWHDGLREKEMVGLHHLLRNPGEMGAILFYTNFPIKRDDGRIEVMHACGAKGGIRLNPKRTGYM